MEPPPTPALLAPPPAAEPAAPSPDWAADELAPNQESAGKVQPCRGPEGVTAEWDQESQIQHICTLVSRMITRSDRRIMSSKQRQKTSMDIISPINPPDRPLDFHCYECRLTVAVSCGGVGLMKAGWLDRLVGTVTQTPSLEDKRTDGGNLLVTKKASANVK